MMVTWQLRGFDKTTGFEAVDFVIPRAMPLTVRQLLPEKDTARLADAPGLTVEPDRYYYSVESDEDAYVVAAHIGATRAKA